MNFLSSTPSSPKKEARVWAKGVAFCAVGRAHHVEDRPGACSRLPLAPPSAGGSPTRIT